MEREKELFPRLRRPDEKEAVRFGDRALTYSQLAAAAAGAVALESAVDTAKDCVQVLGGIGFTWEHDAHLYYKRAKTSELLLGTPDQNRARLADLLQV